MRWDVLVSVLLERGIQAAALCTALILGVAGAVWLVMYLYGGLPMVVV
jgi:hypothetical protein